MGRSQMTPQSKYFFPGSFGAPCMHATDLGGPRGPRIGAMATSVSLSTRVSPELRQRLVVEARARRVPLATLARDLLAAGVDGGAVPVGEGSVLTEVECLFYGLPPEAGLHREICRSLAMTVEAGAGGQV